MTYHNLTYSLALGSILQVLFTLYRLFRFKVAFDGMMQRLIIDGRILAGLIITSRLTRSNSAFNLLLSYLFYFVLDL
jgi:hypothetical protein